MRTYIKQLVDLVSDNFRPGMVVCEVGVRRGDTTKHYAPIVKAAGGQVIAIDWFAGSSDVHDPASWDDFKPDAESRAKARRVFIDNVELDRDCDGNPNAAWMFLLEGHSVEMAKRLGDKTLDICFIDAGHTYREVMADIAAYFPKVKNGGYLCGDDCEDITLAGSFTPADLQTHYVNKGGKFVHPGVIQAVSDSFRGWELEIIPGPTWTPTPVWCLKKQRWMDIPRTQHEQRQVQDDRGVQRVRVAGHGAR